MENIELIQKTAVEAAGKQLLTLGRATQPNLIVLASDQKLHSLERFNVGRERYRGALATTSIDDFSSYVDSANPHEDIPGFGAVGFVDIDNMAAKVFFNLGTVESPGHGDWNATLTMQPTAAYKALHAIDSQRLDQTKLTEWLEDWSDFLVADFPPDAAGDSTLVRAVASIRKMKISNKSESTSNVGDFAAQRSAMEEVEAKSADLLPVGFRLATEPYEGLSTRSFALKLSVLTGGEKPLLVLRWQRKEAAIEAIAREFKSVLASKLGEKVPLTIGNFNPGA
jgi:uncharacterized protein YfdQ (DUF2303 family)